MRRAAIVGLVGFVVLFAGWFRGVEIVYLN